HQIEQSYLKEVDRGELMETAIRAIVGKLDTSASYLGSNDLAQINETVQQRIGGIGAKLKLDEDTRDVVVEAPMPNSPDFRAGLRPGDKIISVNGTNPTPGKEMDSAVKMLRGPAGESVTANIKRAGIEGLLEVRLVRESVKLPTVLGDRPRPDFSPEFMLDDSRKIGMVRLTYLGQQSPAEIQAAMESLLAHGMKSLILDLRNNPGGLLDGA